MEKPIMKDVLFLQQPSEPATETDKSLILDLQDTLNAHRDHCVGISRLSIRIRVSSGRSISFPDRSHRRYSTICETEILDFRGRAYA